MIVWRIPFFLLSKHCVARNGTGEGRRLALSLTLPGNGKEVLQIRVRYLFGDKPLGVSDDTMDLHFVLDRSRDDIVYDSATI